MIESTTTVRSLPDLVVLNSNYTPSSKDLPPAGPVLGDVLARRRSIRRLHGGPLEPDVIQRVQDAVLRTPAAFGVTPWHVVLFHARRDTFWHEVEQSFRAGLSGERLERYLDRLDGFRSGVAVALVFEDLTAAPAMRDAWQVSDDVAQGFVQQGLGMVQLAIWLALTAEGLSSSLQHWEWLLRERPADFAGLDRNRYRLAVTMPIGYAAEAPRPAAAIAPGEAVSFDPPAPDDEPGFRVISADRR